MNAWLMTTLALLPPLGAMVVMCCVGSLGNRLAAVQSASSVATFILICMSFAFGQPSSIDLALTFGLLTLPASLLFAVFVERWI